MAYLYIISESENDDLFIKGCVEKLANKSFEIIPRRSRGGIAAARRNLQVVLKNIGYTGDVEDTYFVVALDNDRSRVHPYQENPLRQTPEEQHANSLDPSKAKKLPNHERDKPCRFCELRTTVGEILGPVEEWPIAGAIGVPVQMLESWILLICDPGKFGREEDLPMFSLKDSGLAKKYFSPKKPPEQLKDLTRSERERLGMSSEKELINHCVEALVPADLASVSPSFALFRNQVLSWAHPL